MRHSKSLLRSSLAALTLGVVAATTGVTTAGNARDLTIGLRAPNQSVDPHWMTSPTMFQVNSQMFEPLLHRNDDSSVAPLLATKWERTDDVTWIFHLRKDVKWHDGKPFTAEDVKFTYMNRAGNVPNAPNSFRTYLTQIKETIVVDPYTVKIVTNGPAPTLLDKLVYVLLVSKHVGETAATKDYNDGKAVIGTGPYKFVSWSHQSATVMERNPDYWGQKAPWDKVTYKVMENGASRLAALLSGDIDLMDTLPATEIERLKSNPDISIWSVPTAKLVYFAMDSTETAIKDGAVSGPNGEILKENPLANADVREAMSISVDRDALVKRIYDGHGVPTGNYLPPGKEGHLPSVKVPEVNIARAKELLKKSGWAGKFKLTISLSPALFENAMKVGEAVAQSWTQIGIPTKIASYPYPVLVQKRRQGQVAVQVSSYTNSTGTAGNFYPTLMHSRQLKRGFGVLNYYKYSEKKVDELIEKANMTMDDAKRNEIYQEVTKLALADRRMVPLFHMVATHASRKGVVFHPRADFQVRAYNAFPADMQASTKSSATSGTAKKK